MIRHPRHEEAIEHPLSRQAAAILVQVIGHRYGRQWLTDAAADMGDDPPHVPSPLPDVTPIDETERTA